MCKRSAHQITYLCQCQAVSKCLIGSWSQPCCGRTEDGCKPRHRASAGRTRGQLPVTACYPLSDRHCRQKHAVRHGVSSEVSQNGKHRVFLCLVSTRYDPCMPTHRNAVQGTSAAGEGLMNDVNPNTQNSQTTLVHVGVFLYILGFVFATFTRHCT